MNKKYFIITIIASLLLILLSVYNSSVKSVFSKSTNLSNVTINDYKLNNNFKSSPEYSIEKDNKFSIYDHHKMNSFLVTTSKNNRIVSLELLGNASCCDFTDIDGLKLYESKDDVKRKFGSNYYIASSDRYDTVMVYTDKLNKYKLVFGLSINDKVNAIILFNYGKYDYQYE